MEKELGVYVHIPFCVRKCNYCDFLSFPSCKEERKAYVKALLEEISYYSSFINAHKLKTVYFGGGTPSLLDTEDLKLIFDAVTINQDRKGICDFDTFEATIEVNPGTVDYDKLKRMKEIGFNRLSIGLQSVNDDELKLMGRIHTYEDFLNTYSFARKAGFENINIDIISSLPYQTEEKYLNTLNTVISLEPEHISSYSLIIEEGTLFFEKYANGDFLPDEDTDRAFYKMTNDILEKHGYHRYEISNYSKHNFQSRHNSSYWTGKEYLGVGLGASSLVGNERRTNTAFIKEYLKWTDLIKKTVALENGVKNAKDLALCNGLYEVTEVLSKKDKMSEFMILGLRMTEGIKKSEFRRQFGKEIEEVFGKELKENIKNGTIVTKDDVIRLSEFGLDVSNRVFCDFL
ncbi:MAG: radical SAM family heme chaperone HemW [Lachnospiraceae bacterium]|nr:radical SAM family heme chaperone HemW [Lachnospiraceae bacterium]